MKGRKASRKRKPTTLSTAEAVGRIDRMMPILYRNVANALRIEATLEVGNEIVGRLPNKNIVGAGAYNAIKQSLSHDLALHLSRLFDVGVRNRHPNQRDVASIPLMVRLLRQERCRKVLSRRARSWLDLGRSQTALFEGDCLKALGRASDAYSAIFVGPYGRSGIVTLKRFRDTFMAHSLMTESDANPAYNQLFRLTDGARDFVEAARLAVTGTNSSLADFETVFQTEARHFWERALAADLDSDYPPNREPTSGITPVYVIRLAPADRRR